MAIISPGVSPAGTLESAARLIVVAAHTRSIPRCGSVTCVVCVPDVTVPLATITALPCDTSSAPVTFAALSGFLFSSGTIAIGPASTAAGRKLLRKLLRRTCKRQRRTAKHRQLSKKCSTTQTRKCSEPTSQGTTCILAQMRWA